MFSKKAIYHLSASENMMLKLNYVEGVAAYTVH